MSRFRENKRRIITETFLGCMTVRPSPDLQTHTYITLSQLFLAEMRQKHALGRTGSAKVGDVKTKRGR